MADDRASPVHSIGAHTGFRDTGTTASGIDEVASVRPSVVAHLTSRC